jgi:hypothetical protein
LGHVTYTQLCSFSIDNLWAMQFFERTIRHKIKEILRQRRFLPALVRMYNAGLYFALLFLLFLFLFLFLRTHYSEYSIIVQFHHAFSILHHYMHPCHAALPGSLARKPCPVALPGSLARQPCPAALPGSLVQQPCPAALPGSLARKPCPAALPCSLARQPCPAVFPGSLA